MKKLNKYIIPVLILYSTSLQAQYLSNHKAALFGTKYYVDEVKVTKKTYITYLESFDASKKAYKESVKFKNLSTYCNVAQWIMVALQINEAFDKDTDYGYRYLGANVLFGVGTVFFKGKSNSLFRLSVDKFNRKSIDVGVTYPKSSNNLVGLYLRLN